MADDKRIRELQTRAGQIPLNWRLPFDYTDLIAAEYKTMQLLVDTVNANLDLPQSFTGTSNPDNALGTNGSTYYKYVAGATFGIWFKSGGTWTEFLEITLAGDSIITVTGTTTDPAGTFDASATGTARLISVYEGDVLIRPEFNKATFLLSAMNPGVSITAYFI